ncbi:Putative outer membrane protein precursor [Stieleria maiorica]|uniref:Outer membrane protein n=1 Tax=Stieleria maiorica TaxID=2795974 RepID=A0A5B9M7P3_9BACT|nr:outer membrane protein transport protein [Stieleria maiorica]QEF96060.1 Putative outer membrane protein precursor [Stieleria maiorica]
MKKRSKRTAAMTALASWVMCSFAVADGTIRDGISARSIGRGGANIAMSDNAHVMLDNPAGLVRNDADCLFELGGHLLLTDLEYDDGDNPRVGDIDNPFPIGEVAIAKKMDDFVTIGFGVFSHAGFSAEYMMNGPAPFSGRQHYKSIGALARLLPTLSLKLTDRLSVGTTLGAAINHIELEGPYTLQGPNSFAGTPTRMDLQGTGAGLSWSVGMQYDLNASTTVGVSYQHETTMELDGTTVVEIPGMGSARYDSMLDVKWPRSLGVGLAHRHNERCTLLFDAIWYDWSSAYNQFDLSLQDPDNGVFQFVAPTLLESFPLDWRDTVSLRFGIERKFAADKVFRAGYAFHRNPIPDSTVTPYIQTILEHALSFGYGCQWRGLAIDAAYQWSFGPSQSVDQSGFMGGDFDDSWNSVNAHQFSLSLQRAR